MKIVIQGQDYASALDATKPLAIVRKLNQPSSCAFHLSLQTRGDLAVPERNQSLTICGDDGTSYFNGYISAAPSPGYVGRGVEGPFYRLAIVALSEEALLDQLSSPITGDIAGSTIGSLMESLAVRSGSSGITATGAAANTPVNFFCSRSSLRWTERVREALTTAGVAYRLTGGIATVSAIGATIHTVAESADTFTPGNLHLQPCIERFPVNDVTVCGEIEPVTYVTEYFQGDGVTTNFYLGAEPFTQATSVSTVIEEKFDGQEIDNRIWSETGQKFSLGAGGLTINGGNGNDGETVLSWRDQVEMGGGLLMEVMGLNLLRGSSGVVGGFFDAGTLSSNCIAGFQVAADSASGNVTLQPLIHGLPAGTSYIAKPANLYTLRMRVHGPEMNRLLANYCGVAEGNAVTAGGAWISSPGKLQLEVQEYVNGVGGMPVVLYDGTVESLPGVCSVIAASSLPLSGSMRAFHLTRLGSGWVVSTPPGGQAYTRRSGSPTQGGECQFLSGGRLQFLTGFTPVPGELIAVSYRTAGRSIGRAVSPENEQSLSGTGKAEVTSWIGSVTEPPPRCSADCRNAAFVTAQVSDDDSSVLKGSYICSNFELKEDVWPGDALSLNVPAANLDASVIVRTVELSYGSGVPDKLEYRIGFANEWAEDLSIKCKSSVPADAWLQVKPSPTVLPNLSGLKVANVDGETVSIDTGMMPPTGGGFEVRRRDFEFMAGADPGLVIRSSQPNITFSRESANDRFYVRMYDGAIPPNYSEFSAALFINLPIVA